MKKQPINFEEWNLLNELFSCYQKLLSEKITIYLEEFLVNNLSYNEIATTYNVSKYAVYDQIQKGIEQLKEYEKLLLLNQLSKQRIELYQSIIDNELKAKLLKLENK
ncbi:DNA-binding protein [Mycoplasma bradburyae]|uniref:DNA-binding protein n=1 Tax=Mycoplasma bradburyae TaxID=2963128 RepID=UPI0020CB8436|nr:DNA-binding protein [Mycoplasma bradburyae]UTS71004.1 DNA-binding protein [Mycoplasma bradburyae]